DLCLSLLLRAGELECGVADTPGFDAQRFSQLTDSLAEALVAGGFPEAFSDRKRSAAQAPVPEHMSVSRPEGFAYYNLHPLTYAGALNQIPALPGNVVVVGIRSIGTTLSAVVAAAARQRGVKANRFTVRPGGHPYNRRTEFFPGELRTVQSGIAVEAAFLI